ncbi:MAG: sigma-54-dependent Fis family transcriptional regulator [Candidatus Hydrogenedentes bacterium]|nr:sigma-54-dependent Fis family transcriptional regulator [Candidatus Hydrogenedentota bacterium]
MLPSSRRSPSTPETIYGGLATTTAAVRRRRVAATNAPLEEMVADGRFRTDLYYRLNQFPIYIPPLRERKEDIPLLVNRFLLSPIELREAPRTTLSSTMMQQLFDHDWPGNVRELKAVIDRFGLTGELDELNQAVNSPMTPSRALSPTPTRRESTNATAPSLKNTRESAEAEAILDALRRAQWNRREAARLLGIGYGALRYKIAKYGLQD